MVHNGMKYNILYYLATNNVQRNGSIIGWEIFVALLKYWNTSYISIFIGYIMHTAILGITMVLCNVLIIQNTIEFTVP